MITADLFPSLLYFLLFILIISRFPVFQIIRGNSVQSVFIFIIKCFCACISAWYIINYYHAVDSLYFLEDTNTIYSLLHSDPGLFFKLFTGIGDDIYPKGLLKSWTDFGFGPFFNDNRTIIRLNILIRFITDGSYFSHLLFFNIISYMGLVFINRSIINSRDVPLNKHQGIIAVLPFLIPAVLIWPGLILKESPLVFIIGLIVYSFHKILQQFSLKWCAVLILSCCSLIFLKTFLLFAIVPALIIISIIAWNRRNSPLRFILSITGIFLLAVLAGWLQPGLHLPSVLYGQQLNMLRFTVFSGASTYIDPVSFAPSWQSFIIRIPEAVWFTISNPGFGNITSAWVLLSSFENLIIIIAFVLTVINIRSLSETNRSLVIFCLLTALIVLVIVGYTNTAVGNMVRYKMPAFLLIMTAFSVVLNQKYFKKDL